jgi:hypothetical protein
MTDDNIGYVYSFSNPSMPGIRKIGITKKYNPDERADQLHTTGVPTPFIVEHFVRTSNYKDIEKKIHKLLDEYRVDSRREFFRISKEKAIEAIKTCIDPCDQDDIGPEFITTKDITKNDIYNICKTLSNSTNYKDLYVIRPEPITGGGILYEKTSKEDKIISKYKSIRIYYDNSKWPWINGNEMVEWNGSNDIIIPQDTYINTRLKSVGGEMLFNSDNILEIIQIFEKNGLYKTTYSKYKSFKNIYKPLINLYTVISNDVNKFIDMMKENMYFERNSYDNTNEQKCKMLLHRLNTIKEGIDTYKLIDDAKLFKYERDNMEVKDSEYIEKYLIKIRKDLDSLSKMFK